MGRVVVGSRNLKAFDETRKFLADTAALCMPDYKAAQDSESGRPLELYVDACEYGRGCTLAQRACRDGAPKPIACFSKSFSPTEQAWSTFERELSGLKESLVAVDPLVKGSPLAVYTDHQNNLFTGSLLANKRMQKKLLRWTLEIEELGSLVQRVWLAGNLAGRQGQHLGGCPQSQPKRSRRRQESSGASGAGFLQFCFWFPGSHRLQREVKNRQQILPSRKLGKSLNIEFNIS